MKAVIMAGGKGTRVASISEDIPKPMLPVCGKPVLQYQIEALKKAGHTEILLIVGHLSGKIKDYFKDGAEFGVSIEYFTETEPLGTAGALFECIQNLGADFLLINGDILFDIDFKRFIEFHYAHKALATLAAHPNNHPFDSAILETDAADRLTGWLSKEDPRSYYSNIVNSGIHIISSELIYQTKHNTKKVDLDRDILKPNIPSGRLFVYNTPEYIKDMGTPERFYQAETDIQNGIPALRNLANKQRAVFIDRDGTLNTLRLGSAPPPLPHKFVTRPEELQLLEGAAEAVRLVNSAGLLAIVITNQPVIARGLCSLETLTAIHRKLETDLGKEGAYLNAIYFCPHHPDKGFAGEAAEYKIDCACRKPKPGMILQAAGRFNIDVRRSWMIGDSFRDVDAGKNAGCKTIYIDYDGRETGADFVVSSLLEGVKIILQK
ncbi:MAG: HAD-IIIA family hydrolase [Spirochaetaceae bacterium]|jgi:histidinol-phosphate phosphatase family protein|nr:HAD-IIIA family hydrolase [Spirochaetaceae bacterium]